MTASRLIAIVDDDPLVGSSIDSLVRSAGYATIVFCDGPTLLSSPQLDDVCCVVSDLNMPEMNGLELQTSLLAKGGKQRMIIMTAFPTAEARNQALSAGAIEFLTKPVDPDVLLDAIATTVS